MSKGNAFENELLTWIFNAGLLEALPEDLYISLHTDSPGEAGNQLTNEADYGGYTRVAIERSDAVLLITANLVENIDPISFPMCLTGSNTLTHFGIGTSETMGGKLLYYGELMSEFEVVPGVSPVIESGDLRIREY